jgi:general secretion pathway protein K
MRTPRKTERGVALLASMMGIALMTIVIMDFTSATMLGYRSAANQANEMRAEYLARSGVQVGIAILAQDARKDAQSDKPYDGLDKFWATPFPPIPISGGLASVSIVDETRKINVNDLVDTENGGVKADKAQMLIRLFAVTNVPQEILPALIDWLDPDSVTSPGGAEADYYMRLMPPYAPRNGPMPTIGDLRMVRGVDDAIFFKLSQLLTVEPEQQVNINTAPPEVLAALTPEMSNDPQLVKEILAARQEKPFVTVELTDLPGFSPFADKLQGLLTTRSDYFTINGRGSYAGTRKTTVAVVRREGVDPIQFVTWYQD